MNHQHRVEDRHEIGRLFAVGNSDLRSTILLVNLHGQLGGDTFVAL